MNTLGFFQAIYGEELEEGERLVVAGFKPNVKGPPERITRALKLENATYAAERDAETHDVYFGLALRRGGLEGRALGKREDLVSAPGIAIDIDISHKPVAGQNFFPTMAAVETFLFEDIPHRPAMLLGTGGGAVAFFLFHERERMGTAEEILAFDRINYGWHKKLHELSPYALDSTDTLQRIWRPLGTRNHKKEYGEVAIPVTLLHWEDRDRVDPAMLEDWAKERPAQVTVGDLIEGACKLRATAKPPLWVALGILNDRDLDAQKVWVRKTGMKHAQGEDGASEYDLALLNIVARLAVKEGRQDEAAQAWIDTSIYYRSKYGSKARDERYYARTWNKFCGEFDLDPIGEEVVPLDAVEAWAAFAEVVGIPELKRIYRSGEDEVGGMTYIAEVQSGNRYAIGDSKKTLQPAQWEQVQFELSTYTGALVKKDELRAAFSMVQPFIETDNSKYDARIARLAWDTTQYLETESESVPAGDDEARGRAIEQHRPFIEGDTAWISVRRFQDYMRKNHGRYTGQTANDLERDMEKIGWARLKNPKIGKVNGIVESKRYWFCKLEKLGLPYEGGENGNGPQEPQDDQADRGDLPGLFGPEDPMARRPS